MRTMAKPRRRALFGAPILMAILATQAAIADDRHPVYTLAELAAHDNLASCWMAIEGKVYDVTAHVALHPTEPDVIAAWCGREATEAMRTQGGIGEEHSEAAWGLLDLYQIGTLSTD